MFAKEITIIIKNLEKRIGLPEEMQSKLPQPSQLIHSFICGIQSIFFVLLGWLRVERRSISPQCFETFDSSESM